MGCGRTRAARLLASLLALLPAIPRLAAQALAQAEGGHAADGVVPDGFRQAADGADDGPAIRRAVAAACAAGGATVRFRARRYRIDSPIAQDCLAGWQGHGWQEPWTADPATMRGTWLLFGPGAFGPDGRTSPVTWTGDANGSRIRDMAVTEPFAPPAAGDAAWTPPDRAPVFKATEMLGGIGFDGILCYGVTRCLALVKTNRSSLDRIYGQAWRELVFVDKSYDTFRADAIHYWPYRSQDKRVMAWTQANAAALLTQRNDTPEIGRIFALGVAAALSIDASAAEAPAGRYPGGTTTGMTVEALSCDSVRRCLSVSPPALGVTFQIGSLRSDSAEWGADPPTRQLAGSSAVHVDGGIVAQIGRLEHFASDAAVVRLNNAAGPSSLQIGSLSLTHPNEMLPGAVIARMANTVAGGPHRVDLSMRPMVFPGAPGGFANKNPGSTGIITWPEGASR